MFALWLAVALNCEDPYAAHIANQLADVEARLRARDVSAWSADLQAERARNLDRLHEYRTRGAFPRNTEHPGQCAPYFIDHGSRACAVGHLMIESGYAWLAEQIARDENNDLLVDIDNASLTEWLARSGLTADEHALIQPCYEMPVCAPQVDPCSREYVSQFGCACVPTHQPDGTNCGIPGDTNACVRSECRAGSCEEIKLLDCDDGDPCTVDECDPESGCSNIDTCNSCRAAGPLPSPSRGLWWLLVVAGVALVTRRLSDS